MGARLTLKGNIILSDRILADAAIRCENGRILNSEYWRRP